MCEFLGVSRSGYYDWYRRRQKADKDEFLRDLIIECQEKNKSRYGYRRVKIWLLREYGLVANRKAILRIMNKYNLLAKIRRKRYYTYCSNRALKYKNLLKRDFTADKPNQKWVTDITYVKTEDGVLFLSAIKDLYDNFIVNYKTSRTQDYNLVDRTIKSAIESIKSSDDGIILHSDQGCQYTSYEYNQTTSQLKLIPSMSRPGMPIDNACAENFFSTLKSECLNCEKPKSFSDAQALIDEYIYYYNYQRLQLKSGKTPFELRNLAGSVA